ncbi:MAG: RNA polymerase sigma factor RpoD/SigA [bacterium]|nr:RNA polymerase sigma factor RpoD/SigA [bacterium]
MKYTKTAQKKSPAPIRAANKGPKGTARVLDCYFTDIRRMPMLTREQEAQLGRRAQSGDRRALNELVESNLRFVVKVATEYTDFGLPLEDLINEGNLGLMEAAERFDPERGVKFISWAVWWIRKAIRNALNEQPRVVRLPLSQLKRMRVVRETERGLKEDLGREPTNDEIAAQLPKKMAKIEPIHRHDVRVTSLDEPVAGEFQETYAETLQDTACSSIEDDLVEQETRDNVDDLCNRLDRREREVISARFGLDGEKPRTLREIGQQIGLSREGVRLIELQAIKQLRRNFIATTYETPRLRVLPDNGWDTAA